MDFPEDNSMRVSAPTIYETLYVQARGLFCGELKGELRRGGTRRVSRSERTKLRQTRANIIPNMIMISDRPAEIEDRAIPGHWEGDLICGTKNQSAIITLVERTTRFVM